MLVRGLFVLAAATAAGSGQIGDGALEQRKSAEQKILESPSSAKDGRALRDTRESLGSRGADGAGEGEFVLIGIGDSLTHGTMDGTNNATNTLHAYLQLVADSLASVVPLRFSQPLFDDAGNRESPWLVPTNVGVDGANIFSIEGFEYYKRVGAAESFINESLVCDEFLPQRLESKSEKVLYPLNLLARTGVTQVNGAVELVNRYAPAGGDDRAIVVLWAGNNDSSTAALGEGGENPMVLPIPADLVEQELSPALRLLLKVATEKGIVSFDPYSMHFIERNLTELSDFATQYNHVLDRLIAESDGALETGRMDVFLLTLPYYSSVGYLIDSEDLEYYLRKLDPAYSVPPTFARVAEPDQPITDPTKGDRVSLLTFGMMYTLLSTGYDAAYVNQVLEVGGVQRDGMVLSEAEQDFIAARIDGFNQVIVDAAASRGSHVHRVGIGEYLNDVLTGETTVVIGGRMVSRKWVRGGAFSLDGVHPGYSGQAFTANYVLGEINAALGLSAPNYDLEVILATDPYVDRDGDGWAAGPSYPVRGLAEALFMLTDPDDQSSATQVVLPRSAWRDLSKAILTDLLGIPSIRLEAERLGIVGSE